MHLRAAHLGGRGQFVAVDVPACWEQRVCAHLLDARESGIAARDAVGDRRTDRGVARESLRTAVRKVVSGGKGSRLLGVECQESDDIWPAISNGDDRAQQWALQLDGVLYIRWGKV